MIGCSATLIMDNTDSSVRKKHECDYCEKVFSTRFTKNRHEQYTCDLNTGNESNTDTTVIESDSSHSSSKEIINNTDSEGEATLNSSDSNIEDSEGSMVIDSSDSDDEDVFQNLVEEALEHHHEEYSKLMSQEDDNNSELEDLNKRARKTLRNVFVDYFLDLHVKEKDPLFQNIMEKVHELREEGFRTDEAIKVAVNHWKYSINKLIPQ